MPGKIMESPLLEVFKYTLHKYSSEVTEVQLLLSLDREINQII